MKKILVVGGGPIGLTAGIELSRHKIIPDLIDKKKEPSTLSRAVGILPHSMKLLKPSGAADKLIDFGRRPHIIIGDFDSTSINKEDRRGEWIEVLDQNKTDLEKTIEWCIMNGVKKIFLLGSGGEREDHTTGNLFTLAKYHDDIKCDMITNYAKIICLSGENYINTNNNQQVSIIATEPIDSIT